jgi:hypothetical protein
MKKRHGHHTRDCLRKKPKAEPKPKLAKEDIKLLYECMGALIFLKDGEPIITDQPRSVFVERVADPLISQIIDRLGHD